MKKNVHIYRYQYTYEAVEKNKNKKTDVSVQIQQTHKKKRAAAALKKKKANNLHFFFRSFASIYKITVGHWYSQNTTNIVDAHSEEAATDFNTSYLHRRRPHPQRCKTVFIPAYGAAISDRLVFLLLLLLCRSHKEEMQRQTNREER